MIIDTALETYPATVVNNTSVNAVPADGYLPLLQADGLHTYLIASKPNGGALWKIERGLLPNTGKLSLQFNWLLAAEALLYGRCFEFDTRITDQNGWTYPCDFQFILQSDGLHLYVATGVAAGNITWQDSKIAFPTPVAGVWNALAMAYTFNASARTCSIVSVTSGTQSRLIPSTLQNQPAAQLGWQASQVVLQKQIEVGSMGGAVEDVMSSIQYVWS